jgi:hypothetical protein
MQYRLLHTLGQIDARKCNDDFGASLSLDKCNLIAGCVIELPSKAFDYLTKTRKHVALMEPAGKVRGEAKAAELTGPAK